LEIEGSSVDKGEDSLHNMIYDRFVRASFDWRIIRLSEFSDLPMTVSSSFIVCFNSQSARLRNALVWAFATLLTMTEIKSRWYQ
jgi:hypothetical protein